MDNQNINIKHVLLGNISTGQIIYEESVTKDPKTQTEAKQIFEKLFNNKTYKNEEQTKITGDKGNYFFTVTEPDLFFLTLADLDYPQRHVFELLTNIKNENIILMINEKGQINNIGKKSIKDLITKYQNIKNINNIETIQQDVNDIKKGMRENIKKATDNITNIEVLDESARRIGDEALLFKNNARDLKRLTWWKNCKLWLIIIAIVIGLALVIVLPIVLKKN